MKKYIILFLCVGGIALLTSCLEKYLDKAPEAGLTEIEVFSKYENFIKYFDKVYVGYTNMYGYLANRNIMTTYPLFWCQVQTFSSEGCTPMCDQGYLAGSSHYIKQGIWSQWWVNAFSYNFVFPMLSSLFIAIRTCNTTLQNIDMLKDGSQEDIDDLIAQAYFVRAYSHFELLRWWGGMPYITKVIGVDDQWDIPRLTPYETLINIAADMDTAVIYFEKAGRMRRDPGPGQVGNLNHPDQFRPNGVAAKAYKARALLYAASPLNNKNSLADWENAAKTNWEAIKVAEQYGYVLLSAADYKKNNVGASYTNEQLWAWYAGSITVGAFGSLVPGIFTNAKNNSGQAPTQNTVDMFETKWGDPLNTQADRDAATALGHYNEQDPYADREPRFYIDIIYNQAPLIGFGKADIYYEYVNGTPVYGYHLDQTYSGITQTGYYDRKNWGDQSVKNTIYVQYTCPLIRFGELYLNYAEAANEAYGPNTPAPGATMTAIQAVNKIRNRIGQPDVLPQFTATRESFRPGIKNERNIELIFEGHYYHDIRRWMDAPKIYEGGLMGVDIEKVAISAEYPTGFKYTRRPLPAIRQSVWKPAMYYWPFTTEDTYKMKSFKPNPGW